MAALSVMSIGGAQAVLPEAQRLVVDQYGWMSAPAFTQAFAVAQVAPGPNVLFFPLIGWRLLGLAGLLTATGAILAPAGLLAFALGRLLHRGLSPHWTRRVKAGLAPLAAGLMLASGWLLATAHLHRGLLQDAEKHPQIWTLGVVAASAIFAYFSKRNPLWAIGLGALAGILVQWAGLV
jgi:chromate transporter